MVPDIHEAGICKRPPNFLRDFLNIAAINQGRQINHWNLVKRLPGGV